MSRKLSQVIGRANQAINQYRQGPLTATRREACRHDFEACAREYSELWEKFQTLDRSYVDQAFIGEWFTCSSRLTMVADKLIPTFAATLVEIEMALEESLRPDPGSRFELASESDSVIHLHGNVRERPTSSGSLAGEGVGRSSGDQQIEIGIRSADRVGSQSEVEPVTGDFVPDENQPRRSAVEIDDRPHKLARVSQSPPTTSWLAPFHSQSPSPPPVVQPQGRPSRVERAHLPPLPPPSSPRRVT